jgi:hypothetical protein
MNFVVSGVMLVTLASIAVEIAADRVPYWRAIASLVLAASAVALAMGRTVRNAAAIGSREGSPEHRSTLARRVYRDHLFCFAAIMGVIVLQLAAR